MGHLGFEMLCVGMQGDIKRNLHAVQAIWPQTLGWTIDSKGAVVKACYDAITKLIPQPEEEIVDLNVRTSCEENNPTIDLGADWDATYSRYKEETVFGPALFDTDNTFNKDNPYLLLWNKCHYWNKASSFVFN